MAVTPIGACCDDTLALTDSVFVRSAGSEPACRAARARCVPTAPAAAPTATAAPAASAAESPVPSGEEAFSGFIDLGYRWVTGVGGNQDTYRPSSISHRAQAVEHGIHHPRS